MGSPMTPLRLTTLLVLALAGCTDEPTPTPEQVELESKREQFTQTVNGSYRFTWRRNCECSAETTAPIRITVQQGSIIQALYVETEVPVSSDVLAGLATIDGVFDQINDAYNENAAAVTVIYDPTASFPTSVAIDYSAEIADEELSLQITDLQSFDAT